MQQEEQNNQLIKKDSMNGVYPKGKHKKNKQQIVIIRGRLSFYCLSTKQNRQTLKITAALIQDTVPMHRDEEVPFKASDLEVYEEGNSKYVRTGLKQRSDLGNEIVDLDGTNYLIIDYFVFYL